MEATFAALFLNTWVGRGKSREDAHHTHGCARCEYVARMQGQGKAVVCIVRCEDGKLVVHAYNV